MFFGLLPISLKAPCYWGPFVASRCFCLSVFGAGELIMELRVVVASMSIVGLAVEALRSD